MGSREVFSIRVANRDDVARIIELIEGAHLPARFVEEFIDGFVVAEQGWRIVGCGGVERYEETGMLRSFVVEAAEQGRGIGRALGEAAIRRAKDDGIQDIYLFTLDRERFWGRLGFVDIEIVDWREPARESWQYRYVSTHPEQFPGLHSMRRALK